MNFVNLKSHLGEACAPDFAEELLARGLVGFMVFPSDSIGNQLGTTRYSRGTSHFHSFQGSVFIFRKPSKGQGKQLVFLKNDG